jgi:hypothetical protein
MADPATAATTISSSTTGARQERGGRTRAGLRVTVWSSIPQGYRHAAV